MLTGIAMFAVFYGAIVLTCAAVIILVAGVGRLFPRINRILIGISAITLASFGLYQLYLGATSVWS